MDAAVANICISDQSLHESKCVPNQPCRHNRVGTPALTACRWSRWVSSASPSQKRRRLCNANGQEARTALHWLSRVGSTLLAESQTAKWGGRQTKPPMAGSQPCLSCNTLRMSAVESRSYVDLSDVCKSGGRRLTHPKMASAVRNSVCTRSCSG